MGDGKSQSCSSSYVYFWNGLAGILKKSLVKKHEQSRVKGNFSMIVLFHKWLNTDLHIACNFSLFSGSYSL